MQDTTYEKAKMTYDCLTENAPETLPAVCQGMHGLSGLDNAHALNYCGGMLKTLKYRLYPNKQQQHLLEQQLEECRWLYNHLLAD